MDQDARRRDESVSSLVVAADMLRGVSSVLDNMELGLQFTGMGAGAMQASKQARKVAHKLGKKVFGLVMDMLDGDAEEVIAARSSIQSTGQARSETGASDEAAHDQSLTQASSEQTLVERVKGISLAPDDIDSSTPARHGPVLDLAFVRAANLSAAPRSGHHPNQVSAQLALQTRFQHAERNLDLSNALLFALLGSASKLLGQSFRSLLLRGSYPLISGVSASSDLVRQASSSAMRDIAFNTAYADVKNCLLDHADYILGAACQRLISGLDEELRAVADAELTTSGGGVSGSGRGAIVRNGGGGQHEGRMEMVVLH